MEKREKIESGAVWTIYGTHGFLSENAVCRLVIVIRNWLLPSRLRIRRCIEFQGLDAKLRMLFHVEDGLYVIYICFSSIIQGGHVATCMRQVGNKN